MSFAYRPTPVLNTLPPGPPPSTVKGGRMLGVGLGTLYPGYYAGMRTVSGWQPWITRSGAMGRFGGLGQDDDDDDDTIDSDLLTITAPDYTSPDYGVTAAPIVTSAGSAIPDTGSALNAATLSPTAGVTFGPPAPAGSVSTPGGTVVPAPSAIAQLASSITSLFTPKTTTPTGYTALPATTAPSILSQATLIAGIPNWVVFAGGIALLAATAGMARRR